MTPVELEETKRRVLTSERVNFKHRTMTHYSMNIPQREDGKFVRDQNGRKRVDRIVWIPGQDLREAGGIEGCTLSTSDKYIKGYLVETEEFAQGLIFAELPELIEAELPVVIKAATKKKEEAESFIMGDGGDDTEDPVIGKAATAAQPVAPADNRIVRETETRISEAATFLISNYDASPASVVNTVKIKEFLATLAKNNVFVSFPNVQALN